MMRIFKILLIVIFVLFLNLDIVHALSVDKNEMILVPNKSETIGLYANVNEEVVSVKFSLVFSSYDVTANFTPDSTFGYSVPKSTTHLVTFLTPQKGNIKLGDVTINVAASPNVSVGTINIHSVTATTVSGQVINLNSQSITVSISESATTNEEQAQQVNTTYNLLSKIESNIVKIDILDNVYSYDVEIPNDVTELDLKAIPKDEDYKVEMSSQKISELENNSIKIKVSVNNKEYQEYVVNVKVVEKEKTDQQQLDVDKSEFKGNNSYKVKWIGMIVILISVIVLSILFSKKSK